MMCRYFTLRVCCLLGRLIAVAYAADCNLKQPRQAGNPSGEDIATALTKDNQLASVCSGDFPPSNDRISTYNHLNLIYNVTREDPSQNLQGCQDGFQNIIVQCISNGNYWGGTWSLNGFTYAIYNKVYPSNGLASSDEGGPSSTSANGPTGGPAPTTTEAGDVATTTTSNTDTTTADPIPGATIVSQTNSDGAPTIATVSLNWKFKYGIVLTVHKFAPTTFSQYTTLQSETTVTTTTTRDGVPIIFALVIEPGGIAWGTKYRFPNTSRSFH